MPHIQQLPPGVVNKIAAGEVIERPASAVKELLENSVDAGATRIDVAVTDGGLKLIRVSDNGSGIAPRELTLAVASHATSKIRSAEDLFHVATFGFRGEALASLAEVSQLRIRSRVVGAEMGAELLVNGGLVEEVRPCAADVGTIVEAANLFFNTPVRRKFLRTAQTELGHITESLARIALVHPAIHFTLKHNDRDVHTLPPVADWQVRIAELFGGDLADNLIEVATEDADLRIRGFVADPAYNRANNRMQYLFLNGRCIRDRSLGHALGEAYRGLLMSGRHPIAFLHIELPPDQVDVNVHPTKLEVRFLDGGRVYSQLLGMLRSRFLSTDLTARARLSPELSGAAQSDPASEHFRQVGFDLDFAPPLAPEVDSVAAAPRAFDAGADHPPPTPVVALRDDGTPAIQVYNQYLITESEEGVVVIDQHALHERILYEELRAKVLSGDLEVQRLLVPEPVQVSPAERAVLLEHAETLARLGMEVEPFTGSAVLVLAYPAMLSNLNPADMVRQVANLLAVPHSQPGVRDLVDELLHMISCKAAVKAGDRLSREEITVLLRRRHVVENSHHCPHGRPTALVFSREELDRRFQRI
jgi:DNA mismatch repair protein MutL